MGLGIFCRLEPSVPSAEEFFTDGKNLAIGVMKTTMADSLIFDSVLTFMDKSAGLQTGSFSQMHSPTAGLKAIEETLERLRGDEGAKAIPNADLRLGCIYDLETFVKILREAEVHDAQFILALG